ncbi:MAG: hypothetical protein LBI54_04140, partial [Lachnospiraceae bacterium]|nr:hypothetical protein [Lachnospiraceae bacterium]
MKQMKHMKRFNKRLLSAALALVMALTLLPANLPVLATADGAADVTERAVDNRPYDGPDDSSAPVDGPAGLDGETNAVDDGETAGDPDPADPDGDAADDTGETPGGNETGDPDPADPDGDAADDTGETPDGNETGEAPDEDTPADEADATGGEQADPDAADDAWAPEPVAETDPAAALESQISFVAENTEKFLRTIDPIDVDSSWTAVSDVAGLKALAGAARNTKFYLTNDIDLAGEEWVPIKDFKGIFDGQGYVIRNLTITGSVDDFEVFNIKILVGLFADGGNLAYDDAIIRNVGLEGTKIDVTSSVDQALRVGALWADPGGAQIINCYNEGDVSAKNDSRDVIVGGICGHADYTTIEACKNSGSVAAYSETWGAEAGGICGEGGGTSGDNRWIDGCENYSTVAAETVAGATVRDAQAGGITGTNGYVRNSRNYGGVTAKTGTDGTTEASYALVGGISGSNGKQISNCINEGAISAEVNSRTPSHQARAGGIVGNISSIKEGIDTCTNKGAVTARASGKASARAGGICGEQGIFSGLVISGCVNEGAVLAVSAEPHDGLRAGPSAGGILGAAERTGDDITIEQSTNKGAVTARATGGARAYAGDTSSRKLTITAGCHNEGDVTAAALDKSNAYAHEFYAFFCGLGDKAEYVVINAESCTRHTHKQGTVREIALTVPTAAAKPAITTQPVSVTVELDATEGNTLTVAASSPDGGVLSYQWHQNNTNSASGGWAISGAT